MSGEQNGYLGAIERAHVGQGEQERQCGFGALVLVDALGVEAIAAATGRGIVEPLTQMVLPEEPVEGAASLVVPTGRVGGMGRIEAGRHHRLRFNRLLVEASGL